MTRLDDPIGILDCFGEKLSPHHLREATLYDALGRATQSHERARAPLDFDRRAFHGLRVQVEDRHRPTGRRAQRSPADADVAGADHGNLAGNHAIASSTSTPASTRSNISRRTGGG